MTFSDYQRACIGTHDEDEEIDEIEIITPKQEVKQPSTIDLEDYLYF